MGCLSTPDDDYIGIIKCSNKECRSHEVIDPDKAQGRFNIKVTVDVWGCLLTPEDEASLSTVSPKHFECVFCQSPAMDASITDHCES